ncbi:MAG: DNA topoisomerase [Evtepia gabavorous]
MEEDPPGPVRRPGAVGGHPPGGGAGGGDPAPSCPEEYWTLEAALERIAPNQGSFKASSTAGRKKMELQSASEVEEVRLPVQDRPFRVSRVKRQDKTRNPGAPFTTSTLQQEATRKLNMTPGRTMSIAQQLYEGVDIEGEGTVGLITYMRTDSLRLSDEARWPPPGLI